MHELILLTVLPFLDRSISWRLSVAEVVALSRIESLLQLFKPLLCNKDVVVLKQVHDVELLGLLDVHKVEIARGTFKVLVNVLRCQEAEFVFLELVDDLVEQLGLGKFDLLGVDEDQLVFVELG